MLDKYKIDVLHQVFGFDAFRPGQKEIIDNIIDGHDVFAIYATDFGKSLCYQLSALLLSGSTIVISPLISLMKDQVSFLHSRNISSEYIDASRSRDEIVQILNRTVNGEIKILYISPERMLNDIFTKIISLGDISLIVVDEAHCVSLWGNDFRPAYQYIPSFLNHLQKRPVVAAFSGTVTMKVRHDIISSLCLNNPVIFQGQFQRPELYFEVKKTNEKKYFILRYIKETKGLPGVIYCLTRMQVELIYKFLHQNNISCAKYHAGMNDNERSFMQNVFMAGNKQIMVATNAFGMGVDKKGIRFIIHYSLPLSLEDYYQEAGRAGRGGILAHCILLLGSHDIDDALYLLKVSSAAEDNNVLYRYKWNRFVAMKEYALSECCFNAKLEKYFSGKCSYEECYSCSRCKGPMVITDTGYFLKYLYSYIYEKNMNNVNVTKQMLYNYIFNCSLQYSPKGFPEFHEAVKWLHFFVDHKGLAYDSEKNLISMTDLGEKVVSAGNHVIVLHKRDW